MIQATSLVCVRLWREQNPEDGCRVGSPPRHPVDGGRAQSARLARSLAVDRCFEYTH